MPATSPRQRRDFKSAPSLFVRSSFALLASLALFTFFPLSFAQPSATAHIDDSVYSLSLASDATVKMDITPSGLGHLAVKKHTISATTQSPTGYQLFLATSGSDNNIYRSGDATTSDPARKILATAATFDSPLALNVSSGSSATWGYAIAGLNNFDASYTETSPNPNAKFAGLPTSGSEQQIRTHEGAVADQKTDIYYGVKANPSLASGLYPTAVNYLSVTDISSVLNGEASITPSALPIGYPAGSTVTLKTSLKTDRSLGTVDIKINNQPCTNIQTVSAPPATFTCQVPDNLPASDTGYDVEVAIPKLGKTYTIEKGLKILKPIQSFTPADCQTLPLDAQKPLIDTRDNKPYFVSRLKMNREGTETACWMTQNLGLDLSTTTTLTSDNTDLPAGATWTPERNTINFTGTAPGASVPNVPGWSENDNRPYSANPGDIYYYTSDDTNNSDTSYASLASCISAGHTKDDCEHYHAGNYYNFSSAVAKNDTSSHSANYDNIDQSICPKGWRLPKGMTGPSTSSDFARLLYANSITSGLADEVDQDFYNNAGFNNLRKSPLFLVRSGAVFSAQLNEQLDSGYYQSSSVLSNTESYDFNFGSGWITPQSSDDRSRGISVRCRLRAQRYTLTFDANGGTNAPSPLTQEPDGNSVTFTLPPEIPTRPGKAFKGWATTSFATTPDYVWNGSAFSLNTITTSDPNTTLYAVWDNMKSMQSFTTADCQALAIGGQRQLIDTRDNKPYFVSRLKMNREGTETACWMTQNLGLDLSTTTTLTSDNTDLPAGATWTPERNTINFTGTSIPGWTENNNRPSSANPGNTYYYTSNSTAYDTIYNSLSACTSAGHTEDECKHYSVGNYYNFTAAIAMNDSSTYNTNYQTVPQSICPKGWKLSTSMTGSSTAGDFAKLFYANNITNTLATQHNQNVGYNPTGFTNLRANPLYFLRSGYVGSGSLRDPGHIGYYSSSSVNSPNNHYYLLLNPGSLFPTNYDNRYFGFNVRCLTRGNIYTLNFDANGGTNAPATQTTEVIESSATFTLPSAIPTKSGKVFKGWATADGATTPDYAYNSGAFTPNTITLQHTAPTQTLYAVWENTKSFDQAFNEAGKTKVTNPNDGQAYYTMQDMTTAICNAVTGYTYNATAETTKLLDTRDNKVYHVAKLKMNRAGTESACWMTQNLALDLSTTTTLTSDNTDLPSGTNWTPERNTINFTGTSVPGWSDDNNHPYSASPGDTYYYTSNSNASDTTYPSLAACTSAGHSVDECKHYSAGNYYNFTAAIAMNNSNSITTQYQTVPQSICPKGWRLPTSMTGPSTAGDFAKLFYANNITNTLATQVNQNVGYTSSGSTNLRANPLYFARSGYVFSGSLSDPGYFGLYTSSSVDSSNSHYYLYFDPGSLGPTSCSNRSLGFSVRCVVR